MELKQVHLDIAVYLCVDLGCPYPVGEQCLVVSRRFEEMLDGNIKSPTNSPQSDTTRSITKNKSNEISPSNSEYSDNDLSIDDLDIDMFLDGNDPIDRNKIKDILEDLELLQVFN